MTVTPHDAVRECMSLHLDFPKDVGPEYFELPIGVLRISILFGIVGGMIDCGGTVVWFEEIRKKK